MYVCMYDIYICMYVCMHDYIYIYMCLSHGKFSSPQEVPKSPTQPLRLRAQTEPSQLRGSVLLQPGTMENL